MSGILDKLKNLMLGTEYEEEPYTDEEDDQAEYGARDRAEEDHVRGYGRPASRERADDLDYVGANKKSKNSNVINFQNAQNDGQSQLVITHPTDVQDATVICNHVRNNKGCVVNLEGVDRANAQRIADFLGGVSFALNGEIERVSNEIFIIAPASMHISADLKEELKSGGHVLSWASNR